jgi:predicted sulfurtransferase
MSVKAGVTPQRLKTTKRGVLMVRYVVSIVLMAFIALASVAVRGDDTYVTKEQLLAMLGKSDMVLIDVRSKYDWDESKTKIKGAVREDGMKFGAWMKKYPKDKTIVIYCA